MPGGVHEYMKAWDPEEDQIILEMLDTLGPKWSKIVQRLPGRTVSSVRNRWQRIDKGRKLREGTDYSAVPEQTWQCLMEWYGGGPSLTSGGVEGVAWVPAPVVPAMQRTASADPAAEEEVDSRGVQIEPPSPLMRATSAP